MPDSTSSTILPTYDVSHQKTEPLLKTFCTAKEQIEIYLAQ